MMNSINVLKDYKIILNGGYTYYCYYGGRGGGKTENIAIMLVVLAMKYPKQRILCVREVVATIRDSVRQAIVDSISSLNADSLFTITSRRIYCINGSEFIFAGMGDHFARKIKSIKGINVTWVEEASDISEKSWLTLLPSVLRTPNAKIIVSFNPLSSDDIVYRQFVSGTPPHNSYIKKVCYYDNPFFKDSPLEEQRLHQKETLPLALYSHIWEGEILSNLANPLFSSEVIENMNTEFDYGDIIKAVVACDPATTNKHHSNEYGVISFVKLKNGTIIALGDYSSNTTPHNFANIVCNAVEELKQICSDVCVVVETNQGGDFIKHAIISVNPLINVVEVRAGADKIQRAIPIASLCSAGRVKFDITANFDKLKRQMKLITHNGFIGVKGESPDRLDAFVWGVFYLAGMKNFDTQELYYPSSSFVVDSTFNFVNARNVLFCFIDSFGIYAATIDILSSSDTSTKALVTDSLYFDNNDSFADYISKNSFYAIMCPNNELTHTLGITCSVYNASVNNNELISNTKNLILNNSVMFSDSIPTRQYNVLSGQLIVLSAQSFDYGKKPINPFVILLNYIADNYKNIA